MEILLELVRQTGLAAVVAILVFIVRDQRGELKLLREALMINNDKRVADAKEVSALLVEQAHGVAETTGRLESAVGTLIELQRGRH